MDCCLPRFSHHSPLRTGRVRRDTEEEAGLAGATQEVIEQFLLTWSDPDEPDEEEVPGTQDDKPDTPDAQPAAKRARDAHSEAAVSRATTSASASASTRCERESAPPPHPTFLSFCRGRCGHECGSNESA